ncbi:MAG: zinc transport system ATP-binding protein [Frankiales bacterium]|jgi:zinc transport system ATP-binding protein|nr:zinc transport system ATP-binding protein [Frankiales bacterium]
MSERLAMVDVCVDRGGRPVLHDVSLTVADGETVAVLGPNGAGKSSLVRVALGLLPLRSGSVRLFATPLAGFHDWSRIGWVPQRTTATTGVPATALEVVGTGLIGSPRVPRRERHRVVHEALSTVGLIDRCDDPVASLSGGQQQRVLIARALVGSPELLVLDEPTAGVDSESQQAFAVALEAVHASGTTVLLVAHELGPLAPLISRAVILRAGRVEYDGPPPAHVVPDHDHVHPHDEERNEMPSVWRPW